MRTSFAIPFAAVLAIGTASVAPAQFSKPSQQQQVQLGLKAAREVRQKERVLPGSDPRVQTVRRVGRRLLSTISDGKEPWEYSFDVIDKKDVNAFALPGGPTFIYTGLLDRIKSEDELAGVMAHELTHVRKEHWAYQYRDQQTRNLGLSVLLILTKANQSTANLLNIGSQVLIDLPYSRKHETEADDIGFAMMEQARYNPQGMVDLFTTLQKASGGGKMPEFLSSHPADTSRIARMQGKIQSASHTFPALTPLVYDQYERWGVNEYQRRRYDTGGRYGGGG
ncbi:MAG TPA: M48 family metallopeptidase [Fimbriimonas sp.]|nr:M48 family metallopeptidase [Fimbriimonas sp.]